MLKRHTVTMPHDITVFNAMFNHPNGVMRALAKKNAPEKENLVFAVMLA